MDRRTFLLAAAALPLASAAQAFGVDYTTGLVKERLAAGETVFLVFGTEWCTTCAAQDRAIKALLNENPTYEKNVTFVNVNWDKHGKSDLAKSLKIPRRSTLVALKGNQEIGRIVAGTSKADIQALIDKAVAASA